MSLPDSLLCSLLDSLSPADLESLRQSQLRSPTLTSERRPYSEWLRAVSPELAWGLPHLEHVRKSLARVTRGECRKLLIAWPPQHYKTQSTTVRYALWRMLRDPGIRVGVGTYNMRYANKVSRWTRRLVERLGLQYGDSSAVDSWTLANGSSYIARGAGMGLSGEPVDLWICMPGDTLIQTERGPMRIDDVVAMENRPALLTYNHGTGVVEYKSIVGTSVNHSDTLIEFTDEDGKSFRCTASHRVYVHERGYVRAGDVRCGETLLALEAEATEPDEAVPDAGVRDEDGPAEFLLPGVPIRGDQHGYRANVLPVPECVHAEGGRSRQGKPPVRKRVLLDRVPEREEPRGSGEEVRGVRQPHRQEDQAVLRPVPEDARLGRAQEVADRAALRPLLATVRAPALAQAVLLPDMRGRHPLAADAGGGQLALQDGNELQQAVPGHATADPGAGRVPVRAVRQAGAEATGQDPHGHAVPAEQPDGAPHRRGREEQLAGESGGGVRAVPPGQPPRRVSARPVRAIRTVRGISQPVYDLTVEGNSNFFANGFLVHNCDDPFKNRADADSPQIQEKVWEWHMDDVTPRIQQGGACIVIQTRWNPGDLIGRILASEDGPNWECIRLPAVAESQEERDAVHRRQGLPVGLPDPLGREPGQPLCPQAFDAASLEDKRRVLGVGFETLYQQNDVTRGGQFFERAWFEPAVDATPAPPAVKVVRVRYWDLASSRADSACYTSGVLMAKVGVEGDARYYVEDVVRGRWSPGERNDRMAATAKTDATLPGFERTWFEKPVFDRKGEATKAILARMSGFPVRADEVGGSGSKEVRAEPLSDAARGGLVKVVARPWVAAFLTELEGFPKTAFKDQVDSASGCYTKLAVEKKPFAISVR